MYLIAYYRDIIIMHGAFGELFVQIVQRAAGMSSRSGADQFEG
jgi:hypothetical protein